MPDSVVNNLYLGYLLFDTHGFPSNNAHWVTSILGRTQVNLCNKQVSMITARTGTPENKLNRAN